MTLNRILRIDSSARREGSVTRQLSDDVINRLSELGPVTVKSRDVSEGLPFVDEDWVNANFTAPEDRTPAQKEKLALSDSLVAELENADTIVIGLPIYNFGIPASLKAWVDMIARARLTFKYTENGPVGLLENKKAIVLVASGGTPMGSDVDFATPYIRQALAFVGITDVTFIASDAMSRDGAAKHEAAVQTIRQLAA